MIIAAADVGNEGADWGWLGFGVRRSLDSGRSFGKLQRVITLQAHHAPQDFMTGIRLLSSIPAWCRRRTGP